MSAAQPDDHRQSDCFAPPAEPCECYCLHCNRIFMSDGIWFQKVINSHDGFDGFWMCPTPNCNGAGFTFDIHPTDPEHPVNLPENGGWVYLDDDDESDEDEFDDHDEEGATSKEYDPAEPKYAALDQAYGDDDDDLDGEEWKHGLEPGERPPEPPWVAEARARWEEGQKKYDGPDLRPRVQDWSDRPASPPRRPRAEGGGGEDGEIDESDIPF
jgi:hypothetical protein